jgi:hypothetical protein
MSGTSNAAMKVALYGMLSSLRQSNGLAVLLIVVAETCV